MSAEQRLLDLLRDLVREEVEAEVERAVGRYRNAAKAEPTYLTLQEAARDTGLSVRTLAGMVASGDLRDVKYGGRRLIDRQELHKRIEERR